eukprot:3430579-Amphidinium_carterae.1
MELIVQESIIVTRATARAVLSRVKIGQGSVRAPINFGCDHAHLAITREGSGPKKTPQKMNNQTNG